MALSERHRSSIYRKLTPVLGEEEAQALVSQFPANDLETPATKDFVRAELHEQIGSLRTEMHEQIGSLRTEMHEQFGSLRTEMHEQFGSLRTDHAGLRADHAGLRVEMHDLFRRQTIWMVSTIATVGTAIVAATRLLG